MEYIDDDAGHALLSASGSRTWANCAGALFASIGIDNPSSKYAREGTAAHTLAAMALRDEKPAADYLGEIIVVEDDQFEVDEAMASGVQEYIDRLEEYRTMACQPGAVAPMNFPRLDALIEVKVNYARFLGVPFELAWGTSDAIVLDYPNKTLQVHDLKYGKGERVDAENNTQLILYALGALEEVELLGDWQYVEMVIHQPRLNHVSESRISIQELRNWGVRLSVGARKALDTYEGKIAPVYTAGTKQCKWCVFAPQCGEAANVVANAALEGFDEVGIPNVRPAPATADALGRAGSLLPFVQDWCKSVAIALDAALLHKGQKVPGFKIVRGRAGHRKWHDAAEVAASLLAVEGVTEDAIYEPRELKSPAVLEKSPVLRFKEGRKYVHVAQLAAALESVKQPPGALTVVPVSDPRQEEHVDPSAGFDDLGVTE